MSALLIILKWQMFSDKIFQEWLVLTLPLNGKSNYGFLDFLFLINRLKRKCSNIVTVTRHTIFFYTSHFISVYVFCKDVWELGKYISKKEEQDKLYNVSIKLCKLYNSKTT